MNPPDWLPPLFLFMGDWPSYLNALYAVFKADFIDARPIFQGKRIELKKHPLSNGKEATFWHLIQMGADERNRVPDLRRCERIRWPRPIIENSYDSSVKVWMNTRRGEKRILLWLEFEEYLVVLAERKGYLLLWTAYMVERPHQKKKLINEFETWQKKQGGKS